MSNTQKIAPHNLEAERQVIGAVVMKSDCLIIVRGIVETEDFYDLRHRVVYAELLEMFDAEKPISVDTVGTKLLQSGKMGSAGGVGYFGELCTSASTTLSAEYFAELVKDDALRREMIFAAQEAAETGYTRSTDTETYLLRSKERLQAVADKMTVKNNIELVRGLAEGAYQEAYSRQEPKGLVRTCISKIDESSGGLWPGLTTVLASRPAMGKSTVALNVAVNAALTQRKVLLVSLEDPKRSVMWRLMSRLGRVNVQKITQARLSQEERNRLDGARDIFNNLPLWIDDTGVMNSDKIRSLAMRHKDQNGLDLLIVDHLGHVNEDAKSMYEATSKAAKTLVQAAKEMDIPLLLLHQLNRDSTKRESENYEPKLADLRQSGEVEQLARQVWLLNRLNYYYPDNPEVDPHEMTLHIAKNSHGKTWKFKLYCDLAKMYVAGEPDGHYGEDY